MKWIHIALVTVSVGLAGCAIGARSASDRATGHNAPQHAGAADTLRARVPSLDALGHPPLAFEAIDAAAGLFAVRTPGYALRLAPTSADLALPAKAPHLRMRLIDASAHAEVGTTDPLVTRVNYLLGNDPTQWRADVRTFQRVRYSGVYPGIDLVYYGTSRDIEHDFVIAPGGRPDRIVWAFDGANAIALQPNGDLQIAGGTSPVVFRAPKAYQLKDGQPQPVDVHYRLLADSHVGFDIASYDTTQPLVIDPVLNVATTLGGRNEDEGAAIALDSTGNIYLAGITQSTDFPANGASGGGLDIFVMKLDPTGTHVLFSTYVGGSGNDDARALALDANGNVYVAGVTRSPNFPLKTPVSGTLRGDTDAFVFKLSTTGAGLIFSTYLGGGDSDSAQAIASDAAGNVTVVGNTTSTNFPMANAAQSTLQGDADAFVTRLSPTGTMMFSTYLGGADIDSARAVVVNGFGDSYVTGSTMSTNFPVGNPVQSTLKGGLDAFVTIFNAAGQVYRSTYLGGSANDRGHALALDSHNRLYVAGQTQSTDFPVKNAAQPTVMGDRDSFIVMLPPDYTAIGYATYLGTGDSDDGLGVAADTIGRAYLTGVKTYSWPATTGASDAFVMRLSTGNDTTDTDSDGMPDDWETKYGLDPNTNDANADMDGDGISNLDEFRADTNPAGFYTRYLAEGATGTFFDDQVALFNTNATTTATTLLRFQKDDHTEVHQFVSLPPHARRTIYPKQIPGLESANFSTVIESNTNVIADRTMTWDKTAYGSHAESAGDELSKTWYLAEGSTGGYFDLYYLLQNPGPTDAHVTITYLLPGGAPPQTQTLTVSAHSRFTVHVDDIKALANTDLSGQVNSDQPILVERAMYMTTGGKTYSAGHDAAGVTSPAKTWFLAEGATGVFFDLYVLLANPNTAMATANVDYLLPDGTVIQKHYDLAPQSRTTIFVDGEDQRLIDTPVSTRVTSTLPIVVERAMWWPSPNWYESHDSAGAVVTAPSWAVAEGQVGGANSASTYVLLANTSNVGGEVDVTIFYEDDTAPTTKRFTLLPNSRFNVDIGGEFPASADQRFATLVQSVSTPLDLVVERSTYTNSGNTQWAAGTNSLGTPIFADQTVILTQSGAFPKHVVVPDGARVSFINRDTVAHGMKSQEHPFNAQCPAITTMTSSSPIAPGETRLTGNLVFDDGNSRCGFLDDSIFTNQTYWGEIVIKPPSMP